METLALVDHPIQKFLKLTVETCAFLGTGSVLEVQKLLSIAGQHVEDEKEQEAVMHQVA